MGLNQILDKFLKFEKEHPYTAYFYAVLGNSSMALMQLCAKYVGQHITIANMLYLRSVLLLILNTMVMSMTAHDFYVRSQRAFKLVLVRMTLAAFAIYMYFYPVNCISISIINALWMTIPVWTPFTERLLIGTKISGSAFIAILISFLGILLIIRPEFLFGNENNNVDLFCCMLVLIGAFVNSFNMVILRMLKGLLQNDTVLQYFYFGQLFSNSILMVTEGNSTLHHQPLTLRLVLTMLLLVLFAYIAQLGITRAVYLIPPSRIMPFNYVLVVVSFAIDIFVFNQRFSWLAILGILIVCLSLLYIVKSTSQKTERKESTELRDASMASV